MKILAKDIRIDSFSAGVGIGRISHVKVTHEPTGLTEECGDSWSQFRNREKCLERLKSRLDALSDH